VDDGVVQSAAMTRTLNILSFLIFSSALTVRAVDPVVPQIATDFGITPTMAASLAAAFAAYGLTLPILGPVADAMGKIKVMIACLVVLTVASFLSAFASNFWILLCLRIIAGAACGGSFPIAMAIVSDLVPVAQRQVVIGRLLLGTISGNLLGAALSGVIADAVHWRGVFIVLGCVTTAALALGLWGLRGVPEGPRHSLNVLNVISRYREIFKIRTARICYITVALEGFFLFGVFPYVAVLLLAGGEPRASIAGLVVAAFAIGGMIYSFSVSRLLQWFGQKKVMMVGGAFTSIALVIIGFGPPWPVQAAAFALMGLGFYMLHASIQVYVTELAPSTRSSAVAFHTFSFFIGGGLSPLVYGYSIANFGPPVTLCIAAVAMLFIGIVSAQLLVKPKTQL
jgi:predicted MFS family arabinose efflux permease